MVMLYHLSRIIDSPDSIESATRMFSRIIQFFFLVSAFSIYIGYYNRLKTRQEIKEFLVRRFLRIAPLFYVMLVIFSIYMNLARPWVEYSVVQYLFNITFTYNLVPEFHYGIIHDTWFIGVIMLFYLFIPLLVRYIRRLSVSLLAFVVVFFLSNLFFNVLWSLDLQSSYPFMAPFIYRSIFFQFPIFMIGIIDYFLFRRIMSNNEFLEKKSTKIIGVGLIIVGLVLYVMTWWPSSLWKLMNEIPFINL